MTVWRGFLTEENKIKIYIFDLLVCVPGAGARFLTSADGGGREVVPSCRFCSQVPKSYGCSLNVGKRPKGPERQVTETALNLLSQYLS